MINVKRDLLANSAFYNHGELEWGGGVWKYGSSLLLRSQGEQHSGSLNFLEQLRDTQGPFWFLIGQALCNVTATLICGEENWGATIIFLFAQSYVSIFKMYVLSSLGGFFFSFLVWFLFCLRQQLT